MKLLSQDELSMHGNIKPRRHKVLFITIVPSPYQRDLFGALAKRPDVDLSVCYMEEASPDSPWPEKSLRSFERIMPGFWLSFAGTRVHLNWNLPDLADPDFVIVSTFTSLTGQWLMQSGLRGKRWLFWGERLHTHNGVKRLVQSALAAPIARASGIVGVGRAAQADYRLRFPAARHFCIPYHCDLSAFFSISRHDQNSGPVTFLFCGQMIRRKGVDLLLLAFDRLIAAGLDARLLLVGREAELPIFLQMVTSDTRARICYEGFRPPEELPKFFEESDVFVLPSRHDGWGVVINQALAAGLPIITSDMVGAGLDFVENGRNGVQVPAGDAEALYRAMESIASDRNLATRWGQRSRELARGLTPEAGAEKWVQVFNSLMSIEPN
jgi:glycosyltransferase involved in cell wall biosynthesis